MISTLLNSTIARVAGYHNLPVSLVTAIVRVESEGNPWSVRYEQNFFDRYIKRNPVNAIAPCSIDTEAQMLSTSFGLMQIMGAVARERGFDGPFLTTLCDPETGLEFGCRQLAHLAQQYQKKYGWEGVVAAYNAGSPRKLSSKGSWVNQDYVNKVRTAGGFA